MKITLKDFGPISHFEIDLNKNLHVIFGKNNIGKSYAIKAVYLILKNWLKIPNSPDALIYILNSGNHTDQLNSLLGQAIKNAEQSVVSNINQGGVDEIDITKEVSELLKMLLDASYVKNLEDSFRISYSSIAQLSNKRTKNTAKIILEINSVAIEICANNGNLSISEFTIGKPIILLKSDTDTPLSSSESKYTTNISKNSHLFNIIDSCILPFYTSLKNDISNSIENVYFLPASRSALYQALNAFSAIMAQLSQSRSLFKNKIELPNISEPVSDYFLALSTINKEAKSNFDDAIAILESGILGGKIVFNDENKKIVFRQQEIDEDFELAFTSSMVSEIAPIVAYLKFIVTDTKIAPFPYTFTTTQASTYGILFIEEPEAHLHPEVQVKLMELFANLVGKNLKIVLTSHSNYMFNKLSNLILDKSIDYNMVSSVIMRNTSVGSITDSFTMQAEPDGMNDENFADVAEQLYNERIAIYEKLNNQ